MGGGRAPAVLDAFLFHVQWEKRRKRRRERLF